MNSRYSTFDFKHQRNTLYDASIPEMEQYWSRDVKGRWMSICEYAVAENVRRTRSDENVRGIGTRLTGTRPVDAKATHDLALQLGAQEMDVQLEHIEASIRYWRFHTDLAKRLNCPHCKVADINDQYRHYCVGSTVVAARRKHLALLSAAIHKFGLKSTTAKTLTAIYTLDNEGRHIDPGAEGGEVCARLVDNLINSEVPAVEPTRGTLIALLEMSSSERTQGWLSK